MIELYNEDNKDLMSRLPNESIDVICIDPPYLYLKNQKLEIDFDEKSFFAECRRLLTNDGFIVMFGRGESFYRWNTILADLKFTGLTGGVTALASLLSLHPAKAAAVPIAPKGKKGIPANHLSRSRRLG